MSLKDRFLSIFLEEVPENDGKRSFLQMAGTSLDSFINFFGSHKSKAGQTVDVQSVLGISAVWRAINILADSIASMPVEVIQKNDDQTENKAIRHPINRLLTINPSPLFTPFTLLHTLVSHAVLTGNAYAYIHRARGTGYPKKITIIEPSRVSLHVLSNDKIIYKVQGVNKTIKPQDMIHFGGMSWNGLAGIDVLNYLADNFGLALANQEYLSNFFAGGATVSGVIKHPGRLDDSTMARLRRSWDASYAGAKNSGKTALLEQGMDYQAIGLSPQQAAAGETKKLAIADVARIFGVPQFLLEDLDRATFNNIEHLSLLFIKHTIKPWCRRIESELNRKLFPVDEQGIYVTRFDIDELHMVDIKSRTTYIDTMMKWGILNRDEIRAKEKINPIRDGSGQKYFVPANLADPMDLPDKLNNNGK